MELLKFMSIYINIYIYMHGYHSEYYYLSVCFKQYDLQHALLRIATRCHFINYRDLLRIQNDMIKECWRLSSPLLG